MILKILFQFLQNLWGAFEYPHAAYRRMEKTGKLPQIVQIILIWGLAFLTIAWTSAVKNGIFKNPYFFAVSLGKFSIYAGISYFVIIAVLWGTGKLTAGTGKLISIATLWAFSYIPTIIWFLLSSLLFLLFPPPRSHTYQGYLLSGFLIVLSIALLYWKILLYYLTLRIGFKMTLRQVLAASAVTLPIIAVYSYLLYIYGIFKVPFI